MLEVVAGEFTYDVDTHQEWYARRMKVSHSQTRISITSVVGYFREGDR